MALACAAAAAVVVAAAVATGSAAVGERRFELLAHVDPGEAYTADVYGHRGHAYLSSFHVRGRCSSNGVRVYSLANPRKPNLVSRFADANSEPEIAGSWSEKTIVKRVSTAAFTGDLAVTSFQSCRVDGFTGFGLYDVTTPSRPKLLAHVQTEPRGSHEIWLAGARGRAWVYTAIIRSEKITARAGKPGKPDFRIFDVSDPRSAREVGGWGAWKQLGIHPDRGRGTDRMAANLVHSVTTNAAATRAFLSYWDLGTVILDVSQPAKPRYLGRTSFVRGEAGNAHSAWLAHGEKVLVETRETPGGVPALYDISNARRPVRLSTFRLPSSVVTAGHRAGGDSSASGMTLTDTAHDPKVRGNVALFSWYGQGVVAADISNPRKPRFLARFLPRATQDPLEALCDARCVTVWGVYPLGDLVLASDMQSGLWVLRLN